MTKFTAKETTALLAIAKNGCEQMGGRKPEDLHDDNFSWFRAEDIVRITDLSAPQVSGLMAALEEKGMIVPDDPNPEWYLTSEGITAAQVEWEKAQ